MLKEVGGEEVSVVAKKAWQEIVWDRGTSQAVN